jgi:hypothetical protein
MCSDLILSFLNNLSQFAQLDRLQPLADRQLDVRLQPEFGFPIRGQHMHVHPGFLSGKKVESILPISEHGRTHVRNLADAPIGINARLRRPEKRPRRADGNRIHDGPPQRPRPIREIECCQELPALRQDDGIWIFPQDVQHIGDTARRKSPFLANDEASHAEPLALD